MIDIGDLVTCLYFVFCLYYWREILERNMYACTVKHYILADIRQTLFYYIWRFWR